MADTNNLSNVRTAFDSWRNGRVKRESIPDKLWQMAVSLLNNYPITRVAKELKLNSGHLRQKQLAFEQKKTQKHETQEQTPFIELNQFLPTASTCSEANSSAVTLEIERGDGTRLTLSLASSQTDILQNLVTAFIHI